MENIRQTVKRVWGYDALLPLQEEAIGAGWSGRWSLRGAPPVTLPEIIPAQWWQNLLHNQRAVIIQAALLFKPSVIVTAVQNHLSR